MVNMLGEYSCSIDSKGRLRLPTALLRQLGEQETYEFVINRGFEKCINLYPVSQWEKKSAQVLQLTEYDEQSRRFKRQYLSGASRIEMDNQDRILVPKRLMEHANIDKEIILLGLGEYFEIWDSTRYDEAYTNPDPNEYADLAQRLLGNANQPPSH